VITLTPGYRPGAERRGSPGRSRGEGGHRRAVSPVRGCESGAAGSGAVGDDRPGGRVRAEQARAGPSHRRSQCGSSAFCSRWQSRRAAGRTAATEPGRRAGPADLSRGPDGRDLRWPARPPTGCDRSRPPPDPQRCGLPGRSRYRARSCSSTAPQPLLPHPNPPPPCAPNGYSETAPTAGPNDQHGAADRRVGERRPGRRPEYRLLRNLSSDYSGQSWVPERD